MSYFHSISKLANHRFLGLAIGASLALALAVGCAQAEATATPVPTKPPTAATATPVPTKPPAPTPTPPPPTPTPKPDKVTVIMDWFLDGYHSPVLIAKDKGWYAENNLDVEVVEGKGSGNVLQLVASKVMTFGYADATRVVKAIADSDIPVKMIIGHLVQTPMGVTWLRETPIEKPKDLEGKIMAAVPGSAAQVQFEAFAAINKLDPSTITVINVTPATKDAAILTGKADFGDDFLGAMGARFTAANEKPADFMGFADSLAFMGHSYLAHNDTLKDNPDVVRRFVAATVKGIEYSRDNPKEVPAIVAKYAPPQAERQEYVLRIIEEANKLLESPNTKGNPTGWMSQLDFQETLDTLVTYGGLKNRPDIEDLFTNDFLPEQ